MIHNDIYIYIYKYRYPNHPPPKTKQKHCLFFTCSTLTATISYRPWLHAGPATKRHCGSPPPKHGRDLISRHPSEHRLLQLRHLGCRDVKNLLQPIWIWHGLHMPEMCCVSTLHEVAPSGSLQKSWISKSQIHYDSLLYSTIMYNLFQGEGCGLLITLNNYQTHLTICSRAKRRMSKKQQAHLNQGNSRNSDKTVVWQSLKLLNKSSERKTRQPHHARLPSSNPKDANQPLHETQGKKPWAQPRMQSCHQCPRTGHYQNRGKSVDFIWK